MGEFFICLVAAILLGLVVWAAILGDQEWKQFKQDHHCKVVLKEDSTIASGYSTGGKFVTTVIPGKTGWLCDDGITYLK